MAALQDLGALLSELGLSHLSSILGDDLQALWNADVKLQSGGRIAFLSWLRDNGVSRLPERQALANGINRANRSGRIPIEGGSNAANDVEEIAVVHGRSTDLSKATEGVDEAVAAGLACPLPAKYVPPPQVAPEPPGGVFKSAGDRMLAKAHWAVIGDVLNSTKAASQVFHRLKGAGKIVHAVNPRDASGTLCRSLRAVDGPIEVIDLIINSHEGFMQMEAAAELGIQQVYIQPGASSPDILKLCSERGIEVHHGCVLVEMRPHHHSNL